MIWCRSFKGSERAHIQSHSKHLKGYYGHRFITEQEEWPPGQPKHFTSLTLIHYKDGHTEREVIAIRKAACNTHIDDIMSPAGLQDVSSEQSQVKTSKDIKEIFTHGEDSHEPRSILIEGAPGIGKTFLSKEIAFQWANGSLLMTKILLFLIFLRDPLVRIISNLKDLVKYYYQHENSETVATSCAEYLLQSDGEHVVFVLDGYDEYPENLRQNGFIFDIVQRKKLPSCHLVVTSRPHASAHLRKNFNRYIEILGFTKEDRKKYIEESLQKKQDVDKLVEYLDSHLTINSLCFIPFNMTVLLWLCKGGISLPNGSTELYNYFICYTIRHHLRKEGIVLHDNFKDLHSLEHPYKEVIQQLSCLSYKALDNNQLTFTFDEIKKECPQIDQIPGALNCFGLLQAVQHFGIQTTITLNFVHFSVQEFLAAYHITCLTHHKEFCALKEKFMSKFYANTFTIYVGMTKGHRPAFKQYLNGSGDWTAYMYGIIGRLFPLNMYNSGVAINPGLLKNGRTCFRIFRCFYEADDKALCRAIEAEYLGTTISISEPLPPSDVECLGLFLGSRDKWESFTFNAHCIDDVRFRILHQLLTNKIKPTCICKLHIGYGSRSNSTGKILTQSSSCLITEIAKSCKTEVLEVLTPVLLLKDVVSLKDRLTRLKFCVEENQTEFQTFMPILLDDNGILEELELCGKNQLNEDMVEALAVALKYNSVLKVLYIPGTYCSTDSVKKIKLDLESENRKVNVSTKRISVRQAWRRK